jgi:hypothetical protein
MSWVKRSHGRDEEWLKRLGWPSWEMITDGLGEV